MNETYENELQQEINFLWDEIAYLQKEIADMRQNANTDEYTKLMRIFLLVQKQYLKLCAEQEKRQFDAETDPLTEFAAGSCYDERGLTVLGE